MCTSFQKEIFLRYGKQIWFTLFKSTVKFGRASRIPKSYSLFKMKCGNMSLTRWITRDCQLLKPPPLRMIKSKRIFFYCLPVILDDINLLCHLINSVLEAPPLTWFRTANKSCRLSFDQLPVCFNGLIWSILTPPQ